jgi:hypothetical protein
VYTALRTLKANALEYLEIHAGKDSTEDRYYVGLIAGLNAVLNLTTEDLNPEGESEDDS